MATLSLEVEALGRRESFNKVVNNVKKVIEIMAELENNYNLADVLNDFIDEQKIDNDTVSAIVSSLLVDKYNYAVLSANLRENLGEEDLKNLADELARWQAVDLVCVYFHPELGVKAINPKLMLSWELVKNLKKYELINIYAGSVKGKLDDEIKKLALENCLALLNKEKIKAPSSLLRGNIKVKIRKKIEARPEPVKRKKIGAKAAKAKGAIKVVKQEKVAPEAPAGQKRMTPFYSIPVTNELFHNGNVEAWKKIIESYTTKYPENEVYIFYEGERIHDINSLFKWGKVKHGSVILIAIAGPNVKDVSKLQRYLRQGASPMFEAFLKFPVNQVLNLF